MSVGSVTTAVRWLRRTRRPTADVLVDRDIANRLEELASDYEALLSSSAKREGELQERIAELEGENGRLRLANNLFRDIDKELQAFKEELHCLFTHWKREGGVTVLYTVPEIVATKVPAIAEEIEEAFDEPFPEARASTAKGDVTEVGN